MNNVHFMNNEKRSLLTGVVEAVDPGLRVRLSAVDGTNIVRLAKVVPSDDLDKVVHVAIGDDVLPSSWVQV